jgi:hypothetical protein
MTVKAFAERNGYNRVGMAYAIYAWLAVS